MDIVYYQPLKELLQVSSYFKEQNLIVLVSNEAQEKKVKQAGLTPCFAISEKDDFNKFNEFEIVDDIIDSAIRGDQLSFNIISETGRILGIACANLLNLFDPELIIIGGNLIKAGHILIEPFINVTLCRSKKIIRKRIKIEKSNLGSKAPAFGGVAIVLENFFQTII